MEALWKGDSSPSVCWQHRQHRLWPLNVSNSRSNANKLWRPRVRYLIDNQWKIGWRIDLYFQAMYSTLSIVLQVLSLQSSCSLVGFYQEKSMRKVQIFKFSKNWAWLLLMIGGRSTFRWKYENARYLDWLFKNKANLGQKSWSRLI